MLDMMYAHLYSVIRKGEDTDAAAMIVEEEASTALNRNSAAPPIGLVFPARSAPSTPQGVSRPQPSKPMLSMPM